MIESKKKKNTKQKPNPLRNELAYNLKIIGTNIFVRCASGEFKVGVGSGYPYKRAKVT